jgi:YrbI family 3-deoxy-D-manno-octulosonate 8-phosphate phosphatase
MNIAIIPARGGSKGIPRKNLLNFCGKPLLAWSIEQARGSKGIDEVYVTSDDDEILATAVRFGARPIKRPAEFASDTASSEEALLHALDEIEAAGAKVGYVVFLQATSPLREASDIDAALAHIAKMGADSLFSTSPLVDHLIWQANGTKLEALNYNPLQRGRRQDRKPLILENGSFYIFKPAVLHRTKNRLTADPATFEMPFWKSFEIDGPEDVALCEFLFRQHLSDADMNWKIKASSISAIIYDFDGVMTDNRVLQSQDGTESVYVNRGDGLGVQMIKAQGIPQLILSTEANPVVAARARKLGLDHIQGCQDKRIAVEQYCLQKKISPLALLYVGNDINDGEAMRLVGYPVCPADAHPGVLQLCSRRLRMRGGEGVIRELADRLC